MALVSGACGQSAEAIVGTEAPDEGVLSTRPMPAWVSESPDASGGRSSSGASPSFSGDETNPASTFPTPGVWTAPAGMDLPCLNVRMAFDFNEWGEPESDKEAFWMMWFAMRSFASEQPATAEELASIGFIHYASFDRPATALQAYVAASDKAIVVAFRGTTQWADWVRNFDFAQAPGAPLGLAGNLHRGYAAAIAEVWDDLARTVRAFDAPRKPVWIAGHSLGGALATLAATRFAKTTLILPRLVTFAAPRTGDQAFVQDSLVALRGRYRRIENERDLVPHLPPSAAASEPFAALAPAEILSTPVQSLVRRLDYAHGYPLTLLRDDGTKRDVFGEGSSSGADDIVYWQELAQQARARGVRTVAEVSANQGVRHNERTYLCRMRAWHEAAEQAKAHAQDHHGSNR